MQDLNTDNGKQLSGEYQALIVAYEAVMRMNISHSTLVHNYNGFTFPTLQRLSEQKSLRHTTIKAYLKLFVRIIDKRYSEFVLTTDVNKQVEMLRIFHDMALEWVK